MGGDARARNRRRPRLRQPFDDEGEGDDDEGEDDDEGDEGEDLPCTLCIPLGAGAQVEDAVEFEEGEGRVASHVTSGAVLVDGLTVGDVTKVVLRDRHRLANDGVLIASVVVDQESGDLLSGPDFISRGFIDPAQGDDVLDDARATLSKSLDKALRQAHESGVVANRVREVLSGFIYERTRRRPMILPVVTEV